MKPRGFWTIFFTAGGFFAVGWYLLLVFILQRSDSGSEGLSAAVVISLVAGVFFGLSMAALFRSGRREFQFESKAEFGERLAAAMEKEGYHIAQEAGARLVYRSRGVMGLIIIVDMGESCATATGPRYTLARLDKRLRRMLARTGRG